MVTRLLLVAALCAGAGVFAVVEAAPAAAAGCYGSECAGKDPQAQGCSSDAYSVSGAALWESSFSVELRHSPACSARWSRLTIDDYQPTCCAAIRVNMDRDTWDGSSWVNAATRTKKVSSGLEGTFWTPMARNHSSDRHRSCWRLEAMDNSWQGSWHCTGWY